jgi:4-hydroxy-tetrahydrodipicolinate synthase
MSTKLEGIIVPVATPFLSSGAVDYPSYKKIINLQIDGKMNAIFCLGSSGEPAHLSREDRYEVIRKAAEFVAGRVPICVGAMETSIEHILRTDALAAEVGAECIVLTAPYYFPLNDREMVEFFQTVAGKTRLPILLYNIPQLVKTPLSVPVLKKLSENDKFIGVKDTSGNMVAFWRAFEAIRPQRPDFKFFAGLDELVVDCLALGADGAIPGGPNFYPQPFAEAWQAAKKKDLAALSRLRSQIAKLATIFTFGDSFSAYLTGLKAAMHLVGLCELNFTPPFTAPDAQTVGNIKKILIDLGLPVR